MLAVDATVLPPSLRLSLWPLRRSATRSQIMPDRLLPMRHLIIRSPAQSLADTPLTLAHSCGFSALVPAPIVSPVFCGLLNIALLCFTPTPEQHDRFRIETTEVDTVASTCIDP
jgi:hypothetical protein